MKMTDETISLLEGNDAGTDLIDKIIDGIESEYRRAYNNRYFIKLSNKIIAQRRFKTSTQQRIKQHYRYLEKKISNLDDQINITSNSNFGGDVNISVPSSWELYEGLVEKGAKIGIKRWFISNQVEGAVI